MNTLIFLTEAVKYEKKYKCPYCDYRNTRQKLISHIGKDHQDMIPKDYTPTRVVFNYINKKECGHCIICKKETEWNEDKARYERLCGDKKCHDIYVKKAHDNTGIEEKMKDPYFQQKMLAGRSISGTYKFKDGGLVSYTGSYEKQLLEFLDKFFNIKSYDIQSPGPVIEYEYDGEKHMWITDQYLIPYNLVFDVKDGGNNPNKREMIDYRKKQIAKENAIKKQGRYNYIRLTNNDFGQLIDIMIELKYAFDPQEPTKNLIIRINEDNAITIGALPPVNADNMYIIDYLKRNTFTGKSKHKYALCKDYMQDAITVNNGIYESLSIDDLKYINELKVYKYMNNDIEYMELLEYADNDTDFYELITGKDLLDSSQFLFDEHFEEVIPYTEYLKALESNISSSILTSVQNKLSAQNEGVQLPYFELENYNIKNIYPLRYYRDINGIFLMNEENKMRSKSYTDLDELNKKFNIIKESLINL